jgi:translocation and assembly module TamB
VNRPARHLLTLLALLSGTLLLALGWLLATESGLQFLWRQVAAQAGPELAVTQVTGRLAGRMHIQTLTYDTDTYSVAAEQLEIAWQPRALLTGTLRFSDISVATVHYAQLASEPEAVTGPVELPVVALPLRLQLDALHIGTLTIVSAPDTAPLQLQEIALAARASGSRLTLASLTLAAPGLTLKGSASLEMRDDYPLQGALDWQWHSETLAPLIARTHIEGNLRRLVLAQEILPPYSARAELTLIDVLDTLRIDGTVALQDSALADISSDWPALQVSAALTLAGPLEQLRISGSGSSRDAQANRIDATLDAELQPKQLHIRALQLMLPEQSARLQARGHVDFAMAEPGFDLQLDWQELAWPLHIEPVATSARGELTLTGRPDAYHLGATALIDAPEYTPAQIGLQAQGNLEALDVTAFTARLLDGTLQGSAQIAWAPQLAASLQLTGKQLNPGLRWQEWPGELALRLQASLEASGDEWLLRFDDAAVNGSLRQQPLQLAARGSYRPGALQLDSGVLTSGPTRLQLQGRLAERIDLGWELHSPDLATLAPAAAGQLSGKGRLQGTPQAPRLTAQLTGHELRYQADRIDSIQLDADIDAGGNQRSQLELAIVGGQLAGTPIDKLNLKGSGYPLEHVLTLAAAGAGRTADLAVDGSWQPDVWSYTLTRAQLMPQGLPAWQLQQAVAGRVSATQATLPQACWSSAPGSFCLQAATTETGRKAEFLLEALPLATLAGLLPTEVELQGMLQGEGSYQQLASQAATAHVKLTSTAGELTILNEAAERSTLLAFAPGLMTLELDAKRARFEVALPLQADAGSVSGRASVSANKQGWTAGRLDGELLARLPDIAFAGRLLPDVSNLHGRLDGEFKLAGTPAAPHLQGKLLLSDASALLDTPGLQLEDVQIELTGQPDGVIRLDARARSGTGQLQARGEANLTGAQPTAQLRIEGDDVRILNTLEAEIDASPRLDVALAGTRIDVSGEIVVPRATIQPRKMPSSAVTASTDQIIIEDGAPAQEGTDYPIFAQVRFTLGDAVSFDGLGLTGRLGGSVLTMDEPGQPTRASGELNVRNGKYRAYGQDLDIRRGRLLFAGGPITEPGLDIEAVRQPAPDILAGVKVRGNLQKPVVTLFSEPSMSQTEQLSWLVLGRPLEGSASDSEQSALNNAALMLGMSGGEALGEVLGEKIGVDEIGVSSESGDATSASLLVGKYLTPKLFVSYGIGLFEPVSTLRLRHSLTSHWNLVGEASSLRSSADLFYVIERGK